MGDISKGTFVGLVFTLCAFGFLLNENAKLQNNVGNMKERGGIILVDGTVSALRNLNKIASHESANKDRETPFLDLVSDIAHETVHRSANALAKGMISAVTTSTGFFPSNFLFAAQSIMEYNFFNMFYALNQAFSGLSMTYWNQFQMGGIHNYLDIGNYFAVVSEVFYQFMLVQPLTESKDMPEQDSWLGNFLTSIPNITFQTFANDTTWTKGFSDLSLLSAEFSRQRWRGSFVGYKGQSHSWRCYDCEDKFQSISTQTNIISQAPSFVNAPHPEGFKAPPVELLSQKKPESELYGQVASEDKASEDETQLEDLTFPVQSAEVYIRIE
mmetsp:Transcript_39621/g.55198  ORF Transcript_39621/g.55198 Transcript_39621/m.55198 type:complete len:328 (+) Transcript_39621:59-1042(+)|eukprot:CAMPEP_0201475018 /NCGR_PEP_ID=MMETSP0151_2-20130828/507_1 /ASSEMBLY_ACC=CAM_ASM_000257 /TAXON_ID=200890 /ORGANISM="Paramoeba atlantica, Strain 621/1 / CCAP 1560/9" /LENGTH=327 /DNA_ID=CAMNT_0047855007 /DNA_START=50 /DNA_END=1033 /DNA_ORIENTATION=-